MPPEQPSLGSVGGSCQGSETQGNSAQPTFLYKIRSQLGQMHRLQHGTDSLSSLKRAICGLLCISSSDADHMVLEFDDDEGDRVLLSADEHLHEAVSFARRSGRSRLVIHVASTTAAENSTVVAAKPPQVTKPAVRGPDAHVDKASMSDQERVFLLGSAVALGAIVATVGGALTRR